MAATDLPRTLRQLIDALMGEIRLLETQWTQFSTVSRPALERAEHLGAAIHPLLGQATAATGARQREREALALTIAELHGVLAQHTAESQRLRTRMQQLIAELQATLEQGAAE